MAKLTTAEFIEAIKELSVLELNELVKACEEEFGVSAANADDKVQSFVDAFKSVGNTASSTCHGLPLKLILAMWGGESGWATGSTQNSNQNWSNMIYTSSENPVGNIGKGKNGWAKFEGRKKHAVGFANFFKQFSLFRFD